MTRVLFEARSSVASDRERLLNLIEQAFDGVVLGDGVSLHETIVLDHYGELWERQAARAPDEKTDWRNLVHDPELLNVTGVGGMCFFDAPGLRFHLPAYLCMAVNKLGLDVDSFVLETLLFILTNGSAYTLENLSILNHAQRAAIREVLVFWREKWPSEKPEIDRAIEKIWHPESSLLDTPDRWPPGV
jgi:hypothetical protein